MKVLTRVGMALLICNYDVHEWPFDNWLPWSRHNNAGVHWTKTQEQTD